MTRKAGWLLGGLWILGLWAAVAPAPAAGIDDFKLTKAIPADAMIAVHSRDHDGLKFLNEQHARVWAEVEKQHFDRDFKRMLRALVEESGGDMEAFDTHWQQVADLAAGVEWGRLGERESAFAMKIGMPSFVDMVLLCLPPKDRVATDFDGLAAILKALTDLDTEKSLVLSKEGEGNTVIYKLGMANAPMPMSLMLARQDEVILVGFGSTLPEQALALLSGKGGPEAGATLASTERFKQALAKLPPPTDEVFFFDIGRLMKQSREFAKMAGAFGATSQPADADPASAAGPLAFLVSLVDSLDMWDYAAGVGTTNGMESKREELVVLRADINSKPFGKAFYGPGTVREPLKYVPKAATSVSAGSGIDLRALYDAIIDFVKKEVPEGEEAIAQFNEARATMPIDIEEDLLSWIGSSYVIFSGPIPGPYMPGSMIVLEVKDEAKANAALEKIGALINETLAQQNAGVEDAKLEGVEGFKRVILPPMAAMIPGLGRPVYGIKDKHLFLANGPEILQAALHTAAGQEENFAKNERFVKEGLPLGENMSGFAFKDLTKWGEEMGLAFNMVGLVRQFAPDIAKNPGANTLLLMLSKLGNVMKKFDFLLSECKVTTADGAARHTKSVIHYQEPPKPKTTTQPAEEGTAPANEGTPPAKEGKAPGKEAPAPGKEVPPAKP